MIVLDLNQFAGAAPAAEGYQGLPGAGGSSTALPGLFAHLLSSEQLALMGASPVAPSIVEETISSAPGGVAVTAEAEAPAEPAVPTTWNGLVQTAASVVSSGSPNDPEAAKGLPQGASSLAVASAIVAGQTPAANTEANAPPTGATQAGHTPAPTSSEGSAGNASSPDTSSEGPLFTALAAGKPVVVEKPGLWVQTSVDTTGEPAPPGVVSSANVVTVPSRAVRADQPDVGLPGGAVAVDVEPPADLAARSRAEVVRRSIGDVGAVSEALSANPKAPAAASPAAVPSAAKTSAPDAMQTVKPVQVAQLDAQAAATASESSKSATLNAAFESTPQSETTAEKLAPGPVSAAEADLAIVKSAEALRDGAPLARVEGTASVTTQGMHRVESEAGGTSTIRTPVTELADTAVKSVRYLVSQGENVMRIKLIPENLGEMQLVVRSVGEALHVHVIAAHAHTRDAVEAQLQGLRDQLAKEGIEVTKITVASDASGGQQFAQHSNNRDAFGMQQSARDGGPWRGYGHQNPASAHPDPPWTAENRPPRQHAGALNLFA